MYGFIQMCPCWLPQVRCRLSKRQRAVYEDYMASSDTASTLSSGNSLSIINVLMQLRKVRAQVSNIRKRTRCLK